VGVRLFLSLQGAKRRGNRILAQPVFKCHSNTNSFHIFFFIKYHISLVTIFSSYKFFSFSLKFKKSNSIVIIGVSKLDLPKSYFDTLTLLLFLLNCYYLGSIFEPPSLKYCTTPSAIMTLKCEKYDKFALPLVQICHCEATEAISF